MLEPTMAVTGGAVCLRGVVIIHGAVITVVDMVMAGEALDVEVAFVAEVAVVETITINITTRDK